MDHSAVLDLVSQPEALERTVGYLSEKMRQFLRKGERVLICFPAEDPTSLGYLMARAVERCGGESVIWGPDYRWKTLLRQAFFCKAGTIIGPPLVILGLTKLARAKATPLYIRNVLTAGYACTDWMIDGIINGLDCKTWGCLDWNLSAVAAGFSCKAGRGVHVRSEEYEAVILDEAGNPLPDGQVGELYLRSAQAPDALIPTLDRARVDDKPCSCGCLSPRLMDMSPGRYVDMELIRLGEEINQWTSVLDCRVQKGAAGLEIEIVVFPGERLPRLPSCARLVVRPWNPEEDAPFWTVAGWKNAVVYQESH